MTTIRTLARVGGLAIIVIIATYLFCCGSVILVSATSVPEPKIWTWKKLQSPPAYRMDSIAAVYVNDDSIFLSSGFGKYWCYSKKGNTWSTLAPIPDNKARPYYNLIWLGGDDLYTFDWHGSEGPGIWRYSISANSWTRLTTYPGRVYSGTNATGKTLNNSKVIYVLSGPGNLWQYSISDDSWKKIGISLPFPSVMMPAEDDSIYGIKIGSNNLWRYSISRNEYRMLRPAPVAVDDYSAKLVTPNGKDIFVRRGNTSDRANKIWLPNNEFYLYSIARDEWSTLQHLPQNPVGKSTLTMGRSTLASASDGVYFISGGPRSSLYYLPVSSWSSDSYADLTVTAPSADATDPVLDKFLEQLSESAPRVEDITIKYYELWKELFLKKNSLSEDDYDKFLAIEWLSVKDGYFYISYDFKISWFKMKYHNQIGVMPDPPTPVNRIYVPVDRVRRNIATGDNINEIGLMPPAQDLLFKTEEEALSFFRKKMEDSRATAFSAKDIRHDIIDNQPYLKTFVRTGYPYCSKGLLNLSTGDFRVNEVVCGRNDREVTQEELAKAKALFKKNNITTDECQDIERFNNDQYGTTILCIQFYKRLPVIYGELLYVFDRSGLLRKSENGSKDLHGQKLDPALNIDIHPSISEEKAISIFAGRSTFQKERVNSGTHSTLGIFNRHGGSSFTPPDYVLVWYVSVIRHGFPFAIIDATTGVVYAYDDGIIID